MRSSMTLSSLMKNISYIRQSSFPLHLFKTEKLLVRSPMVSRQWSFFVKCMPIAEYDT